MGYILSIATSLLLYCAIMLTFIWRELRLINAANNLYQQAGVEYMDNPIEEDKSYVDNPVFQMMMDAYAKTQQTPGQFQDVQFDGDDDSVEVVTDLDEYKAEVNRRGY